MGVALFDHIAVVESTTTFKGKTKVFAYLADRNVHMWNIQMCLQGSASFTHLIPPPPANFFLLIHQGVDRTFYIYSLL